MMENSESYRNGWLANKNGIHIDENPYPSKGQQISNCRWLSGWCRRFDAFKNNDVDLEQKDIQYAEYME